MYTYRRYSDEGMILYIYILPCPAQRTNGLPCPSKTKMEEYEIQILDDSLGLFFLWSSLLLLLLLPIQLDVFSSNKNLQPDGARARNQF